MQHHLLQWEVGKVKQLMTSNMTLTVLNLHQKTPKGATTKIQVKRYKRVIKEINSIRYPRRDIKLGLGRVLKNGIEYLPSHNWPKFE